MLATWPGATWADDVAKLRLAGSYWRRRRLEAKLLAVELAVMLAGGGEKRQERISSDEMLRMMGVG